MKLIRPLIGAGGILLVLAMLVPAALAAEVVATSRQVLREPPSPSVSEGGLHNDASGPLFDLPVMRPGQTAERCIRVFLEDVEVADDARVLLRTTVGGDGLADHLDVTVEVGAGGGADGCDDFRPLGELFRGTLADLGGADPTELTTALPEDGSVTYRLTVTLRDEPEAMGLTASTDFSWEIRG